MGALRGRTITRAEIVYLKRYAGGVFAARPFRFARHNAKSMPKSEPSTTGAFTGPSLAVNAALSNWSSADLLAAVRRMASGESAGLALRTDSTSDYMNAASPRLHPSAFAIKVWHSPS